MKNVNNMKRIVGIEENTFSMEVTSAVQLMENREVRNFTGNRKCSEYDDKCRKNFQRTNVHLVYTILYFHDIISLTFEC